ncbi:MAG: patatin-like phospholipase family protein [Patescibacteria group bacterium]|jgi:NTE family protein
MNEEQKPKIPKIKVGLAISGGFIRATAAIGVIEVLTENNIPIDLLAGCSSGSAVAAAYAAGTLPQLKKRLVEGRRRDFWNVIIEPTMPKAGLLKGERNRVFFEEFVGDKKFSDLDKKLILAVTDLASMEEMMITEGPVGKAIQAATAVPGIFVPVNWAGKIIIDGGNFNMIPSKPLYDSGADYVIAVYVSRDPSFVTRFFSNFKRVKKSRETICSMKNNGLCNLNIIQTMWRVFVLSATEINNLYHHAYRYDALIKPDISRVRRYHVNSVQYCINEGRKAAMAALPQIKQDLGL